MLNKKKVLVVEDEPMTQEILRFLLLPKYQVFISENGFEALNFLSAPNEVDLIITDMEMPLMSGTEWLEKFKANKLGNQETPVLMLSSNLKTNSSQLIASKLIDAFMEKPIKVNVLNTWIDKLMADVAT